MATASPEATLRARYPLPEWIVDSSFKRELTSAVAGAIFQETRRRPTRSGPEAQMDYARQVTDAVLVALEPLLAWMEDAVTDGFSYPGDPIVSYISQLALTRPGEDPDPGRYRRLLRVYGRYLAERAEDYDAS